MTKGLIFPSVNLRRQGYCIDEKQVLFPEDMTSKLAKVHSYKTVSSKHKFHLHIQIPNFKL